MGWYIERHGIAGTKRKIGYMMQGSLAERLRILRAREGMTLTEASERIGITRHTLSSLERGGQEPHYPTLAKIARGYGVPVEDLLEEPTLAGKAEAPDQGQPDEGALTLSALNRRVLRSINAMVDQHLKAQARLEGSEGIPQSYFVHGESEIVDLLSSERSDVAAQVVSEVGKQLRLEVAERDSRIADLEIKAAQLERDNALMRQEIAELKAEAEREGTRR